MGLVYSVPIVSTVPSVSLISKCAGQLLLINTFNSSENQSSQYIIVIVVCH